MNEFGVHTNMWTMSCDAAGAANAIAATNRWGHGLCRDLIAGPGVYRRSIGSKIVGTGKTTNVLFSRFAGTVMAAEKILMAQSIFSSFTSKSC